MAEQAQHFFSHVFEFQTEVHQHLCGHTFLLTNQAEEQVFGTDVVVVEVPCLFHRVLDHLLGARRLRQLTHRDHIRPRLHDLLDFESDLPQINFEVLQHVGGNAGTLLHQTEQDVLGADVFVIEPLGFLIGQLHYLAGAISESLVHAEASEVGMSGLSHGECWIERCVV